MSTDVEETKTEETVPENESMYCKVEDIQNFMEQVTMSLLAIVNGINSSMRELSNRSETSDDNED